MNNLTGLNSPLSYLGIQSTNPPKLVVSNRAPVPNDKIGYSLGDMWVVSSSNQVYILLSIAQGSAIWSNLFPGGGGALLFVTKSGTAMPSSNVMNFYGDGHNISTSASGQTIDFSLSNGSNGQLLIGGGTHAAWNSLTSTGNTIVYTAGSNTLNLEASTVETFTTLFVTDSGDVVPSDYRVNIFGGSNINTSSSGSVVTISMNSSIIIPGTITIETLGAGVVQSDASGNLSANYGTSGQIFISSSTGVTTWASLTSTGNTITITETPGHINLDVNTGGGSGTGNYAFLALQTTVVNNAFSNPNLPPYYLGTSSVLNKIFDVGSNLYPGDGISMPAVFTAPVTGVYYFIFVLNYLPSAGYSGEPNIMIVTTQRTYNMYVSDRVLPTNTGSASPGSWQSCVTAPMNMGDTAEFGVLGFYSTVKPNGANILNNMTFISGFLIGSS